MKKGIVINKGLIELADIKFFHPLTKLLNIHANAFFVKEYKYFEELNEHKVLMVALMDGQLIPISDVEDVEALIELGTTQIEAVVVKGLNKNDLFRYINFRNYFKKKGKKVTYDVIKYLKDYLRKDKEGQQLARELEGDERKKIATILGLSETTITDTEIVGDNDVALLTKIDEGALSFSSILRSIRSKRKEEQEEGKQAPGRAKTAAMRTGSAAAAKSGEGSEGKRVASSKATITLSSLFLQTEEYGILRLRVSGAKYALYRDKQKVSGFSFDVSQSGSQQVFTLSGPKGQGQVVLTLDKFRSLMGSLKKHEVGADPTARRRVSAVQQ